MLDVIVPLWRRAIDLAPSAAAYDAMRDAYQRTDGTSKEKQAAACRAGGLTRTDGSAGQRNRRQILDRWYELTRETPRDTRRALVVNSAPVVGGNSASYLERRLLRVPTHPVFGSLR